MACERDVIPVNIYFYSSALFTFSAWLYFLKIYIFSIFNIEHVKNSIVYEVGGINKIMMTIRRYIDNGSAPENVNKPLQ